MRPMVALRSSALITGWTAGGGDTASLGAVDGAWLRASVASPDLGITIAVVESGGGCGGVGRCSIGTPVSRALCPKVAQPGSAKIASIGSAHCDSLAAVNRDIVLTPP